MKKPIMTMLTYSDDMTYAKVVYPDGDVKTGKARCVGGDKFVPEIGAFIAMCKATGAGIVDTCREILGAMKATDTAGVKVRPVREAKGKPLGTIRSGRVVLDLTAGLKQMVPGIRNLGRVGDATPFRDRNNKVLHVGDLVIVEKLTGTVRQGRKWVAEPGLHFVVCEDSDDPRSKGAYIMGALDGCNAKTGKIDGRLRVRLAKTWKNVELGEVHNNVVPIWEGDNRE